MLNIERRIILGILNLLKINFYSSTVREVRPLLTILNEHIPPYLNMSEIKICQWSGVV